MNRYLAPFDTLKNLFFNGLLMLLPITITIAFFSFIFRWIHKWLYPIRAVLPQALQDIPFSEMILAIGFVILVGLVTQFFLITRLWSIFEDILSNIPLLRPVYFGIKRLILALSPQNGEGFQKIVLIEFPRKGLYSIGFITSPLPQELAPTDEKYHSVYLPTTPNPTTGFYVMVHENECTIIDMTKQEAMTLIISGGIVHPERFSK